MTHFISNKPGNLEYIDYNEHVPVSPSPTSTDSSERSLSYNPQLEENCILTIIYGLFLDGNIIFKNDASELKTIIEQQAESNNCYAKCAVTLIEAYNIDYNVLDKFCKSKYYQGSLNRRMSNQESMAINQIERLLDRLGFTLDLKAKPILSMKEQDKMLDTVKIKCNELISIYEQSEDNEHKQIYITLRDKIQFLQDQQKKADKTQQQIQQNFARMSRRGGKKKMGKRRKTKKKKN